MGHVYFKYVSLFCFFNYSGVRRCPRRRRETAQGEGAWGEEYVSFTLLFI